MNSVVLINERATDIASKALSNLVMLRRAPDVGTSYHESPTSSKPLSRNQRFPSVRGCSNRGFDGHGDGRASKQQGMQGGSIPSLVSPKATFRAPSGRCFRYLDCFRKGVQWRSLMVKSSVPLQIGSANVRVKLNLPPFTKAVYLSSRFDRKTDCLRKGEAWKADTLRPHKERLDLFDGCSLVTVKSKRPLHRKPNTHRVAIPGLEIRQVRGPCGNGSISLCRDRPPFTQAVCGTQTRQDGSLNKYQPDSQI